MIENLGKTAFLISKPLQLMIALCIVQGCNFNCKPTFIILDGFIGAREVAERLLFEFDEVGGVVYFLNRRDALKHILSDGFDEIFIDSDVGLRNFLIFGALKIFRPDLLISVYEEGSATYKNNLYSGLKRMGFEKLGVGVYFGGASFVKKIYVFDNDEYINSVSKDKDQVVKISKTLLEFLLENKNPLMRIFDYKKVEISSTSESICSLYLSGWQMDEGFLVEFEGYKGDLFIKKHPHNRNNYKSRGVNFIDSKVPAELLIVDLLEEYKLIKVYDHNSSVRRYINDVKLNYEVVSVLD